MGILESLFGKKAGDGPKDESDQTAEEITLAQFVRAEVERVRSSANRIAHEGIWMTNIAYLLGYDGLMYNSTTRQFQPINRASAYLRKNRIHANKILPTVQNRLARLSQSPPKYDVLPESNEAEDRDAARLGLQTLTTLWEKLEINKKRLFLYMWTQQCGHAYVGIHWDPTLGGRVPLDQNAAVRYPEVYSDGRVHFQGDIRVDICSPFELYPDELAKTDDELQSLTRCKIRRLDWYRAHYPERGHLVKEESAWLLSTQYDQRINSLNSRGPSQGGLSDAMKGCAIEMTRYEAPSENYPDGRMIVVANGVVLENKELPIGEIPYAKFDDTIVAGKYYSETPVTHARPIQDQYNETIRRRAEWTRRLLAGKYKAPRGSAVSQESPNDESGEFLYYNVVPNALGNIEPLQVPMIPEWAYKEEDRLDNMINYIFGISDVSRGELPSASLPAVGAQLLQEQDQTRIGVVTELHERAWAKVGRLILKTADRYYVLPRKLKIAGDNLQYTVKEFKAGDLRGNYDVMVVRGSTLPNSKTLKRQDITNAMGLGLLGNPADPAVAQKILGMLEFGDIGDMWQDFGIDQDQIKRGIAKIEKGEGVIVEETDNHAMWVAHLVRVKKSDKWENFPPEIQETFNAAIEAHLQAEMRLKNMMPRPPDLDEMAQPTEGIDASGDLPQNEGVPSPEV